MSSSNREPKITLVKWEDLAVSSELLGEVLGTILDEETKIRFRAPGISMLPFIRDGDRLTITPVSQAKPKVGKVVAFIHPRHHNLLVHRIIDRKPSLFLIKGDNSSLFSDGWIQQSYVIGCVTSIQRNSQKIRFGLGIERYMIAFLSKYNLLIKITRRLRNVLKK